MKRRNLFSLCALVTILAFAVRIALPGEPLATRSATPAVVDSFFSDCTAVIVAGIKTAERHIRVQAYGLTSEPIAQALIAAKARGVDVQVITDHTAALATNAKVIKQLTSAGIAVFDDGRHAIAHNKIIILDGSTVITGSFNFTVSAEKRNAENIVVITDQNTADRFMMNWNLHQSHTVPIKP